MINFENVSIRYINDFYALYNKTFAISTNTLFLGDAVNGSKAIMRILSKIDSFYDGEVFIEDINIKNINDKDLPLCYIPEKYELFKNKSLLFNLAYPLKIRKIKDWKNLIQNNIKEYNLNDFFSSFKKFLKTKVYKLNKSEQKIICLFRGIIRKPKYVLLEDFFKDLDEKYHHLAIELLKKINQHSIIIACEESMPNIEIFKYFTTITL